MEEIPIGRKIAHARHRKRMTQTAFAARLGVSRVTVANWEGGVHFPLRYLGAIEEVLEISLTGYEPEKAAS